MTLLGLPLAQLATIFAAAGGAVTLLYILRLRRRRITVPFSRLWSRVLQEKQSSSLFRRLKRFLSLLLQLAFLVLITAALGDPRLSTNIIDGRHVVMLIDTSASMKSTDGGEGRTRMQEAVRRARDLVRGLGGSDRLMIVGMDSQVTPLTPFTGDVNTLLAALDKVSASDTRADMHRALRFAADSLRSRSKPQLIIIGDGAYEQRLLDQALLSSKSGPRAKSKKRPHGKRGSADKADSKATRSAAGPHRKRHKKRAKAKRGPRMQLDRVDLKNVRVTYLGVGRSRDNVGIVAFTARRYPTDKLSYEVFLEIVNYRAKPAEVDLQLFSDGQLSDTKRLALAAGERARYSCNAEDRAAGKSSWCDLAAGGELLEARIVRPGATDATSGERLDAFATDDRAFALLPRRKRMRVLLVTKGNLFIEGALLLDENLEVKRIPPAAYRPGQLEGIDAVVFDGFLPKKLPDRHTLVVAPPPGRHAPWLEVAGVLRAPLITEQSTKHPVMRFITLKDVNISRSVKFARRPAQEILAASFRAPLIVAGNVKGNKRVAIGFNPKDSDLVLRVAFPLLMVNTFNWFAGGGDAAVTTYRTGETWQVDLERRDKLDSAYISVRDPEGSEMRAPVEDGRAVLTGRHAGVYRLSLPKRTLRLAANLADPEESNIAPRARISLGGRRLAAPSGFSAGFRREIWIYLLLAAMGLTLVEWLTYNRRVTV